jgi:hypothetical protein
MFNSNLVQNVNLKLNNTFRNYSFLPRAAVPQWPQHDTGPARHGTQVRVKITRSESEVKFPRPRVPSRPVPSSPRPRSRGRIPLPATGLGSKTPCMPQLGLCDCCACGSEFRARTDPLESSAISHGRPRPGGPGRAPGTDPRQQPLLGWRLALAQALLGHVTALCEGSICARLRSPILRSAPLRPD